LWSNPKQSAFGRFSRSLDHEAASFHTVHKFLGVVPKGATWGDVHGLALSVFYDDIFCFAFTQEKICERKKAASRMSFHLTA